MGRIPLWIKVTRLSCSSRRAWCGCPGGAGVVAIKPRRAQAQRSVFRCFPRRGRGEVVRQGHPTPTSSHSSTTAPREGKTRVGCLASDQHTQGEAHAHRVYRDGSHGAGHRSRRRCVRCRSRDIGFLQPYACQGLRPGGRIGGGSRVLECVLGTPGRCHRSGRQAEGPAYGHQGDRLRRGRTPRRVRRALSTRLRRTLVRGFLWCASCRTWQPPSESP